MPSARTIPQHANGSTVTFTVKVDGQAIPRTLQVFALSVVKEANRIPWAKISLIDGDPALENFLASNEALFVPGKEIDVFAGHQSQEDLIFKGVVVKHGISIRRNGASQLKIECRDKAFKMAIGRKSRYFKEIKDSEMADQLASEYDLTPTIEETPVSHPELIQYDMTDWDFMLSRLDANGKVVIMNNGVLQAAMPDFRPDPVLTLQYGATILEFDAEMDARNQYPSVQAQVWDYSTQEILDVEAQEPSTVQNTGNVTPGQLAQANGLDRVVLRHPGNMDQQELQTWADTFWQKSRMAKIRGRVKFDGFAGIKPGDLVNLQGVGDRFSGKVWVSGIRHDVAEGSWTTDAQFGLDPEWFAEKFPVTTSLPTASPITGLHIGVVTQLEDDPASEGRILVKLPLVDVADEGTWVRIASLDAGDNRGAFFRPTVGDEVVVGFVGNDPRNAIVLGMLHSSKKPAPLPIEKENKEKGFFLSSGMKMLFNDEDKSMLFETPAGNQLLLSEKDKAISLQDQNGNKLVLNEDGISLESAKKLILKASGDIETEGINLKSKASAQFKAEGSAGVEVSSSAITVLKGSLVQIN